MAVVKRYVGAGLIAVGLFLAALVIPLWTKATTDAEHEQTVNRYAEALSGQSFDDVEPDRTVPIAVGAVGAVLFLAGVIVVVSPSSDS